MYLRFLILISFLLSSLIFFPQQTLSGLVISKDTQKPLAGCSVFLSNTSIATVTDGKGFFFIPNFPVGRFDLIISYISHETFIRSIQSYELPLQLQVEMITKVNVLNEVTVGGYEKGNWNKWGRIFSENFFGQSAFAKDCKIQNPHVIEFQYYKKTKDLKAISDEPLIIKNVALGYTIHYRLEDFVYNTDSRHLFYMGFPYFEEMKAGKVQAAKWEKRRAETYKGSMMHFLRSLYRNTLQKNQFEVRRFKTVIDSSFKSDTLSPQRISAKPGSIRIDNSGKIVPPTSHKNPDSSMPFSVSRSRNIVGESILPGDSIVYALDSVTLILDFPDRIQITYTGKPLPEDYKNTLSIIGIRPNGWPISLLSLPYNQPVQIFHYGSFHPARNMILSGYWAWSEKIATMLPFNYNPPKAK